MSRTPRTASQIFGRPDDLILLAIAAILAILHIRFVPLFLIICVPLLSIPMARWLPRYDPRRDRHALNAGLIAALLGFVNSERDTPPRAMTLEHVRPVPVALARLDGLDSLLSIVQMPRGVPVATVAINGATNAGLLALRILATTDGSLADQLETYRLELGAEALAQDTDLPRS